ncbi:hypothetical protein KKB55_07495, partial [Myxococcota bacterium]|nr:hypothetical protein [Myxococcota bacterium]
GPAMARNPADAFRGRIILSQRPFPTKFSSDAKFIQHMKRVDTKAFLYADKDTLTLNFMAFFSRAQPGPMFMLTVYDVTEKGNRTRINSYPIDTYEKNTRILASAVYLPKDQYEEERRYMITLSRREGSPVLAESQFAIKAPPGAKAAAAQPTVVEF